MMVLYNNTTDDGSTDLFTQVMMSQCANTIKRVSFDLGGNAPYIVFNSADVPLAVHGLLASKYCNTGQTCISPNRILVQSGIHDAFVEKLAASVAQLRQGEAFTEGVQQGPLINEQGVSKVGHHTHAHTHARTHACTHARTYTHTHTHTHTRTHAHSRTHTHRHTRNIHTHANHRCINTCIYTRSLKHLHKLA